MDPIDEMTEEQKRQAAAAIMGQMSGAPAPMLSPAQSQLPADAGKVLAVGGGGLVPAADLDKATGTPVNLPVSAAQAPVAPQPAAPTVINPRKVWLGQSSTVTRSSSPELSKEGYDALKDSGDKQKALGDELMREQLKATDSQRQALAQSADKAKLREYDLGKDVKQRKDEYQDASDAYARAQDHVRAAKVDPDRYLRNMSGFTRAMYVIGAAFSGAAGPRYLALSQRMLTSAIQRDISAQRINAANAIRNLQLSGQQKKQLWKQWQAGEKDRVQTTMRVAQLQLQKAALDSKDVATREKYQQAALNIDKQLAMAKEKTRAKSTTVKTKGGRQALAMPRVISRSKGAGKPPPTKLIEGVAAAKSALDLSRRLQAEIKKKGYGYMSRHIPNTDANRLKKQYLVPLAVALRNAKESGVMTDKDFARYNIFGSATISPRELVKRLGNMQRDLQLSTRDKLRSYSSYYNTAPLSAQMGSAPRSAGKLPPGARKQ